MPNRLVREGILDSERVNQLGAEEEVFYRRLMSAVDDFGRFDARPATLITTCYPLRHRQVTDEQIRAWLAACERAGLVRTYTVAGKPYLVLLDFRQQVRAKSSRYPDPPSVETGKPRAEPPADPEIAQQVRSTCAADAQQVPADAHLDGGAGGVGDGVGDVKSSQVGGVEQNSTLPTPSSYGAAALLCRQNGITVTSQDPSLRALVDEGLSQERLAEAIAIARMRKPAPQLIPFNYLATIARAPTPPPRSGKGEQRADTFNRLTRSSHERPERDITAEAVRLSA